MEGRKDVAAALGTKNQVKVLQMWKDCQTKRDCLDKKDPKQTKVVNVRSTSLRSSLIPASNWDIMLPTVRNQPPDEYATCHTTNSIKGMCEFQNISMKGTENGKTLKAEPVSEKMDDHAKGCLINLSHIGECYICP